MKTKLTLILLCASLVGCESREYKDEMYRQTLQSGMIKYKLTLVQNYGDIDWEKLDKVDSACESKYQINPSNPTFN